MSDEADSEIPVTLLESIKSDGKKIQGILAPYIPEISSAQELNSPFIVLALDVHQGPEIPAFSETTTVIATQDSTTIENPRERAYTEKVLSAVAQQHHARIIPKAPHEAVNDLLEEHQQVSLVTMLNIFPQRFEDNYLGELTQKLASLLPSKGLIIFTIQEADNETLKDLIDLRRTIDSFPDIDHTALITFKQQNGYVYTTTAGTHGLFIWKP